MLLELLSLVFKKNMYPEKFIYPSLLFIVAIFTMVKSECPDDSLLTPCFCENDEHITCTGDKPINFCEMLKKLAKKLTDKQKDLEMFILSNSAVEEFPDNCFDDIYFREIRIQNAVNLKKINSNAFKGTDQLTENFFFINSPKFDQANGIFTILNKFKKLSAINIENIGLKEIPSKALHAHNELVWVLISGKDIVKIGEKPFSAVNSLVDIHITNTSITEVPKDAFVFIKSETPMEIALYNNPKMTKFAEQAFIQTGRPTTLDFSSTMYSKQIPVLEEKVFRPFLELDEMNKIEMNGQEFNCNECENAWIKKDPKKLERVMNVKCADGKAVADSFANCK